MEKVTRISPLDQPLFQVVMSVPDPRVPGRCIYPLINILFITLCAVISGADSWKAIETFAKERKRWLSQFIDMNDSTPSHFTFARVLARVDATAFEQCLRAFVMQVCRLMTWDVINIDGKTAHGSGHSNGDKKKMHLINAYHARSKSPLGSARTPDKSNEIKGIPTLLKDLNITGTVITIDAVCYCSR